MGYRSDFFIEADKELDFLHVKMFLEDDAGYSFDEGGQFVRVNNVKWLGWRGSMARLSKAFPGVTFRAEIKGEEFGDLWLGHAKDGEVELLKADVVWPESKISGSISRRAWRLDGENETE